MLGHGAIGQLTIGQVQQAVNPISPAWSEPTRRPKDVEIQSLRQPFIASAVHIGWFGGLSEPQKEKKVKPALAIALIASGLFATLTVDTTIPIPQQGWRQALSEPVRTKTRYPALIASGWTGPIYVKDDKALVSRWFNPLGEPVRRKGTTASLQSYFSYQQPPIIPTVSWFANLNEPVRKGRITTSDQSFIPLVSTESVTTDKWFKSFAEPVRIRILQAAYQQAFAYHPFPIPAPIVDRVAWSDRLAEPVKLIPDVKNQSIRQPFIASAIHIGWFNSLSEPVPRAKAALNVASQPFLAAPVFTPAPTAVITGWFNHLGLPLRGSPIAGDRYKGENEFAAVAASMKWFSRLAEPVRQGAGLPTVSQQFLAFVKAAPFPETVTESRWHQPWSEPVRIKPQLNVASQVAFAALNPFPLPTVTVDQISWSYSLADPVRTPPIATGLRDRYPFIASAIYQSWFNPLSEPNPRAKSGLSVASQWFYFAPISPVAAEVITTDKWFNPLSESARTKQGLGAANQRAIALYPFPQVSFGWFGGLNEPVRNKPRVAWTDHISFQFPFIPSFGWFNKFDDFTRSRRPISWSQAFSFSPSPIIPSYGWYGRLTEPVRIKPRALRQIFSVVPESTPAFFYLAALNTTEQRDFFFAVLYQFNPPLRAYVDIIEKDPRHRGNLGIIEPAAEPSIIASIVPQSASVTGGTPVPTVAGARVAIIT